MTTGHHTFALEICAAGGESLGQHAFSPDWTPAKEALEMDALRTCGADAFSRTREVNLAPQWAAMGPPYVSTILGSMGAEAHDFPLEYFRQDADLAARSLLAEGKLHEGAGYTYKLLAYERPGPEPHGGPSDYGVEDVPPDIPIRETENLDALRAGASLCDEEHGPGEFLLLIHSSVADDMLLQAERAGAVETGGILVGHLWRMGGQLAVEVTAQIPARHVLAEATSLEFTPDTWEAAQTAVHLRRQSEIFLGWQHSHPSRYWCREAQCTPEKRAACPLQRPFLSAEDKAMHRAVFPKAFQVAMLCNVADGGLQLCAYGWQHGTMQRRAYLKLAAPAP